MTLIALTIYKGYPILIGDIYFTQNNRVNPTPTKNVILPTYLKGTGDIFDEIESQPHSIMQKLYVINPHLAIGLAGRGDQMVSFLRSIRAYFRDTHPSFNELNDFLQFYDPDKKIELGALILHATPIKDNQFSISIAGIGSPETTELEGFGKVFAIGSGAKQFIERIKSTNWGNSKVTNGVVSNEPDIGRNAFQQSLQMIGRMLGLEAHWAVTINEGWGIGFELLKLESEGFKKLEELTTLVMNGNYNADSKNLDSFGLVTVMKYRYHNGVFLIHTPNHWWIVPEIDKEIKDYDLSGIQTPIDFNSSNIIYYFNIEHSNNTYTNGQFVIVNHSTNKIKFFYKDSKLEISIDPSFRQNIEGECLRRTLEGY